MSKPRLKAVNSFRKSDDSWQHCCRWCHYFSDGKCWNKKCASTMMLDENLNVFSVAENGYSAQAIEETLNTEKHIKSFMLEVESILDKWNISQKRKKEFEKHFIECWSEFADFTLKEELDEAVSLVYQKYLDPDGQNFNGIEIDNPSEFYCKGWC